MLNFAAVQGATLRREPYPYTVIDDALTGLTSGGV